MAPKDACQCGPQRNLESPQQHNGSLLCCCRAKTCHSTTWTLLTSACCTVTKWLQTILLRESKKPADTKFAQLLFRQLISLSNHHKFLHKAS